MTTPNTLEAFIADNWSRAAATPKAVTLMDPYRETIEARLDAFDPDEDSWRDYRSHVIDAVPSAIVSAIDDIFDQLEPVPPPR